MRKTVWAIPLAMMTSGCGNSAAPEAVTPPPAVAVTTAVKPPHVIVPDGVTQITFEHLNVRKFLNVQEVPEGVRTWIPEVILALDGKRVRIRGWIDDSNGIEPDVSGGFWLLKEKPAPRRFMGNDGNELEFDFSLIAEPESSDVVHIEPPQVPIFRGGYWTGYLDEVIHVRLRSRDEWKDTSTHELQIIGTLKVHGPIECGLTWIYDLKDAQIEEVTVGDQ